MSFITLAVITALCLSIPTTRLYGVIGLVLLLYLQPYYTTAVLLVTAGAFYHIHQRRKSNEQRRLHSGRT